MGFVLRALRLTSTQPNWLFCVVGAAEGWVPHDRLIKVDAPAAPKPAPGPVKQAGGVASSGVVPKVGAQATPEPAAVAKVGNARLTLVVQC